MVTWFIYLTLRFLEARFSLSESRSLKQVYHMTYLQSPQNKLDRTFNWSNMTVHYFADHF